jgi:hypothetical protein
VDFSPTYFTDEPAKEFLMKSKRDFEKSKPLYYYYLN